MSDIAIKIENVSKKYRLGAIGGTTLREEMHRFADKLFHRTTVNPDFGKKFTALQDINLEVKKGDRLGIIGHNGAGKSTLLKLLARITAPTTGTISYNGRISSMLEVGTGFHGELTGRENIYMNGAILGMRKWEIDKKMDSIIEFAEMEKFIDTPVKRYSSGMYVKLAFAVAAHLDNEIMIMDEVLAVGDVKFQQKCLNRMDEAANKEGRTILFVSHNMSAISNLCNIGLLLSQGKIQYQGNVNETINSYLNSISCNLKTIDRKPNATKKIQFLKIMTCSSNGIYKDVFSTDEEISLNIEIQTEIIPRNEVLTISMYDARRNRIFTNDIPLSIFMEKEKRKAFQITYPSKKFEAGRYSWQLCIHYPNIEGFDLCDDVCPFQIVDTTTSHAKYTQGTHGIMFMGYKLNNTYYPY